MSIAVWGISDGKAGMMAQIDALAAGLDGAVVVHKTIALHPLVAWLPSAVHVALWRRALMRWWLETGRDALSGALPDLVVSCGRKGGLAAMSLRANHLAGDCAFVHIGDPYVASRHFDRVIAMAHDGIRGANVMYTDYALHRITPAVLEAARARFAGRFAHLPRPYISVLIGGSTNKYTLSDVAMAQVIGQLQALLDGGVGSVLITVSRRTGAAQAAALRAAFADDARVYYYDGEGENPYLGLLSCADFICVTNDSVNMMSEALATGRPVYIMALTGHAGTKPALFAQRLVAGGQARWFDGVLAAYDYDVPAHMEAVWQAVREALAA